VRYRDAVPITAERFAQGLTFPDYLGQMSMNRDRYENALAGLTLTPEDTRVLERYGATRKVMVITEDWCGTSLAYVPVIVKMLESRPDIELRVFPRDRNPDVMDQYLKRGQFRSIPVIVFFDDAMNELARFIESRPAV
jgi:hypothetical protein